MKFTQKLIGRIRETSRASDAIESSRGFPTRRQWLAGAAGAIGSTALAEVARRPAGALAQESDVVDTTTNQTIGGIKTFTEPPVVPAGTFAPPPGTYLGPAAPVAGDSADAIVGAFKLAGEDSDRLRFRADGAILGGLGGVPPALEFKPNNNASAWEMNRANLKLRADTSITVSPELHFHSRNGRGTDQLAWGIGIDVANLSNPAQDLAFFKGVGDTAADEFYGNGRGTLPSTWAFGQAPADDGYKLSVVATAADPAMGGLKIQIETDSAGHVLALRDGLQDRVWFDSAFWFNGQGHSVAGSSLAVKADGTNRRSVAMALDDGSGIFAFEHNSSSYIRFRAISTATNIVQFGADGTTFLYGPVTINAGATVQGDNLTFQDNRHVVLGSSIGTRFGTSPNQKLGFFDTTPVRQPSGTPPAATDIASALILANDLRDKLLSLGLIA